MDGDPSVSGTETQNFEIPGTPLDSDRTYTADDVKDMSHRDLASLIIELQNAADAAEKEVEWYKYINLASGRRLSDLRGKCKVDKLKIEATTQRIRHVRGDQGVEADSSAVPGAPGAPGTAEELVTPLNKASKARQEKTKQQCLFMKCDSPGSSVVGPVTDPVHNPDSDSDSEEYLSDPEGWAKKMEPKPADPSYYAMEHTSVINAFLEWYQGQKHAAEQELRTSNKELAASQKTLRTSNKKNEALRKKLAASQKTLHAKNNEIKALRKELGDLQKTLDTKRKSPEPKAKRLFWEEMHAANRQSSGQTTARKMQKGSNSVNQRARNQADGARRAHAKATPAGANMVIDLVSSDSDKDTEGGDQ